MCGIAGRIGPGRDVLGLLQAIAHRGPDHRGEWSEGIVALAAARLRTSGDRRSDQPIQSQDERFVLVGNGEVFNADELGPRAPGSSDLKVWLELFARRGPQAFERIRGPFAIAVFDRHERTLWLARDERSVRPLFLRRRGETLWFASEMEALLALGGAVADPDGWDALFALQFPLPDRPLFAGIEEVPPGTAIAVQERRGRLVLSRRRFQCREGQTEDLAQASQRAFELQGATQGLKRAVTLSGGLDSSAVLAALTAAGQRPDLAVVGYFPEGPAGIDERPYAREVAAAHGVRLREAPITAAAYRSAWEKVIQRLSAPIAGPGSVSQYLVAEVMAQEGIKVAFSGQGGDELFGGYERHRLLLARDLGQPVRPLAGYELLLPDDAVDPARHLLFRGAELIPHLEPERARGILAAASRLPSPGPELAERLLAFELRTLLPGLLLVEDHTLAAFGIEGRVPLLDPILARRAIAEPLDLKSPPAKPRALFRSIFAGRLSAAAARRTDKLGFPVPLRVWLRGPFRDLLTDGSLVEAWRDLGFTKSGVAAIGRGELTDRASYFVISVALSHRARARRMQDATAAKPASAAAAFAPPASS